jgi:hypothetical protein
MAASITRKERLHRCYFNQELDRPGVYVRNAFPDNDPSYDRMKAYLREKAELKVWFWGHKETNGARVDTRTEPGPHGTTRKIFTLHTPAGDLERSDVANLLKGQAPQAETYFLKTREDAAKYLSLPMPVFSGDPAAEYRKAVAEMGDRGIVDVSIGMNPGGSASTMFGSETFALMTVTDRDIVHALCERIMNNMIARVKFLLASGVGPYFNTLGQEYIVPPMHGPKDFFDFNTRYDKPVFDLIHEAGGRVHVHCHGSVKKVFQGFLDAHVDVLHPFEPPAMGDITAKEAKAAARGSLCLEGNIQIADMYEKTPDQVREWTEALIADAFGDRKGLIVCPTASPYIFGKGEECLERCRAMVEAVLKYNAKR